MSKALAADLAQYSGTEQWYRSINPIVTYTDGVKYFADTAGAHWLIDILSTELVNPCLKEGFLSIKVVVTNRRARLTAGDGNGNTLWRRKISYTDCPSGTWKFFMAPGGAEGSLVLMLPSEY